MAVHFSSGEYDVCVVSIYCPICNRDAENRRQTERIWDWCRSLRGQVGRRTAMFIGTDANGKVGSVRYETGVRVDGHCSEEVDEVYGPVGAEGVEEENENGRQLREFMEAERIVAANTWVAAAAGPTWIGDGRTSRVDYLVVDEQIWRGEKWVVREVREHRALRASAGQRFNDHVPVGIGEAAAMDEHEEHVWMAELLRGGYGKVLLKA